MSEYEPGGAKDAGLDLGWDTQVKVLSQSFEDVLPVSSHLALTDLTPGAAGHEVDATAATGSMRTLGSGAQQAAAGNHVHGGSGTPTFVGARVTAAAAITGIGSGAVVILTFDTERYDIGAFWDAGAPTRLTAPSSGYYHIGGNVDWDLANETQRILLIRANGATSIAQNTQDASAASGYSTVQNVSCDWYLAAGEYVELGVFHSTGTRQIDKTNAISPEFWIHLIGT